MKLFCRATIWTLLTSLILTFTANADSFDFATVSGTNFSAAAFRCWATDQTNALRGVVVLMPGADADGRALVEDGFWQAFARGQPFPQADVDQSSPPADTTPPIHKLSP